MRMHSVLSVIVAMASGLCTPVLASEFYDFVDLSDGYVNIRANILLIEGEEDIRVCKIDMPDALFVAYADQDEAAFAAARKDPVCFPLELVAVGAPVKGMMNSHDLYRFVDNSDGYENIRVDVVMIEGETDIKFCKFAISDQFFEAYAANDAKMLKDNSPSVVCIAMGELVK